MYTSYSIEIQMVKNYKLQCNDTKNCTLACIYLFVVLSNDTNMNISDFRQIRQTSGNVSSSTCAFYQILGGLISF